MSNKVALIFGISGQDGGLLSKLLLNKGYKVHGTSRDVERNSFSILSDLGIKEQVELYSISNGDFQSILMLIEKIAPDEIYNLSGQSSVGLSFKQPLETIDSVLNFTVKVLESIRILGLDCRFYQASSSEMFGNTSVPADEKTPFLPRSPYAIAKAAAHSSVMNYREAYNLFACCGILFNHESKYRPLRYVTQRIVESAVRIAHKQQDILLLGNINIKRDWGWAEEYVETMWMMLQKDKADDYVIATGITSTLIDFAKVCFSELGLDAEKYIKTDANLNRPTDVIQSMANPSKAEFRLKWKAKNNMQDVAKKMIQAALEKYTSNA